MEYIPAPLSAFVWPFSQTLSERPEVTRYDNNRPHIIKKQDREEHYLNNGTMVVSYGIKDGQYTRNYKIYSQDWSTVQQQEMNEDGTEGTITKKTNGKIDQVRHVSFDPETFTETVRANEDPNGPIVAIRTLSRADKRVLQQEDYIYGDQKKRQMTFYHSFDQISRFTFGDLGSVESMAIQTLADDGTHFQESFASSGDDLFHLTTKDGVNYNGQSPPFYSMGWKGKQAYVDGYGEKHGDFIHMGHYDPTGKIRCESVGIRTHKGFSSHCLIIPHDDSSGKEESFEHIRKSGTDPSQPPAPELIRKLTAFRQEVALFGCDARAPDPEDVLSYKRFKSLLSLRTNIEEARKLVIGL